MARGCAVKREPPQERRRGQGCHSERSRGISREGRRCSRTSAERMLRTKARASLNMTRPAAVGEGFTQIGRPQGTPLHQAGRAPPLLDSRLRENDGVVTRAPFAVAAGTRTLVGGGAPPLRTASGAGPAWGWVRRSGVASFGSFWRTFSHPGGAVHACAGRPQRRCGEDNDGHGAVRIGAPQPEAGGAGLSFRAEPRNLSGGAPSFTDVPERMLRTKARASLNMTRPTAGEVGRGRVRPLH